MVVAATAGAAEQAQRDGAAAPAQASTVLVRALKLTGLDANYQEHVLLASEHGELLPLADLTRIATHLDARHQPIPEGAYHSLQLHLANDVFIYGAPDGPVHTQLRSDGAHQVVTLSGVILVANREISPLALTFGNWGPKQHGQTAYLASDTERSGDRRKHDDEDDD